MGQRDGRRRVIAIDALEVWMQMAADKANSRNGHKWRPIDGIESAMAGYDFQEIDSLQRQWLQVKSSVERAAPDAYKEFNERLTRRWAIETGIIEGIYDLDRGVTETLVAKGIAVDYIERGSTDKEPSELAAILIDHQDAVEAVNFWIREGRPLTKTFICGLHSQILRKQNTSRARNQFGNMFDAKIIKGEFKKQPNNPKRPDGTIHEYCPPEQVESELDTLLELYDAYDSADCHPLLLAAWLHHRFEQIHPFQDGNGRVGRAVLTWHLVRKGFFPIVVSRDDRTDYIDALENADAGDLTHLIDLFVDLEKSAVLQVLSESETETQIAVEPQIDLVDQVVSGIVARANRKRQSEAEQMRFVNEIAIALRNNARDYLDEKTKEIQSALEGAGICVTHQAYVGGPGDNEHWYQRQVIETAKASQHWVNLSEPRYFARLALNPKERNRTPRLIFVISLHNTGRQLTGVMAATAFAEIDYHDGESAADSARTSGGTDNSTFKNCAMNPFTFTWNDSAENISDRFIKWVKVCFSIALKHWMDNS